MCTRLYAIGFPCEMDRATAEFVKRAASTTKRRVACPFGEYRIWRSTGGAEVWMHYPKRRLGRPGARGPGAGDGGDGQSAFDPIDDLMGLSVAHAGGSDIRLRMSRALRVSQTNPLDGVCIARLPASRRGGNEMVLTFELLGFGQERFASSCEARVQLTGLAHRIWAYESEAAYLSATPARRLIGKGAIADFQSGEHPDVPMVYRPKPGTLWLLTGEVRRSVRLINPVTHNPYYWIQLVTDHGDIDVVCSPAAIEGDVSVGHTMQAAVALTGRVIERLDD